MGSHSVLLGAVPRCASNFYQAIFVGGWVPSTPNPTFDSTPRPTQYIALHSTKIYPVVLYDVLALLEREKKVSPLSSAWSVEDI
jgi:hypothetical protein